MAVEAVQQLREPRRAAIVSAASANYSGVVRSRERGCHTWQHRDAAVLAADVVGFSRLMGVDEARTLRDLIEIRRTVFSPIVAENRGRVVKLMGDGALVEFASVVDAVNAAVEIQCEEAKASRDALTAAYPNFTIASFKEAMVFDPDALERIADDLRKLGVPEA